MTRWRTVATAVIFCSVSLNRIQGAEPPAPPPASDTAWLTGALEKARRGMACEIALPPGRTLLQEPLILPSGVTLRGAGPGATFLVAAGDFTPLVMEGVRDVTVRDLSVIQEGEGGMASGLAIDGGSRFIVIENVATEGFRRGISIGRADKGESADILLRRCRAERSLSFGFDLNDCRVVTLDACYAFDNWLDGIKLRSRARDVTIRGGESSRNGTSRLKKPASNGNGVDAYAGGEAFLIDGLVMEENQGSGLYMKTGELNKPGQPHGRVGDALISHVRSRRNIGSGLDINRSGGDKTDAPLLANVVVTGGVFEENTASGIYIRGRAVALVGTITRANAGSGIALSRVWDAHLDAVISTGNASSLEGAALTIGNAVRAGVHGGMFQAREEPLAPVPPRPERSVSEGRAARDITWFPSSY